MSWLKRLLGRSDEGRASETEFEALVAEGVTFATQYLMVHQFNWQFGREKNMKFDPETGLLTFIFDEGHEVFCYCPGGRLARRPDCQSEGAKIAGKRICGEGLRGGSPLM